MRLDSGFWGESHTSRSQFVELVGGDAEKPRNAMALQFSSSLDAALESTIGAPMSSRPRLILRQVLQNTSDYWIGLSEGSPMSVAIVSHHILPWL